MEFMFLPENLSAHQMSVRCETRLLEPVELDHLHARVAQHSNAGALLHKPVRFRDAENDLGDARCEDQLRAGGLTREPLIARFHRAVNRGALGYTGEGFGGDRGSGWSSQRGGCGSGHRMGGSGGRGRGGRSSGRGRSGGSGIGTRVVVQQFEETAFFRVRVSG